MSIFAISGGADDQASPTPQNRNEVKVKPNGSNPKANVVKVKPIPGGPQTGHAGLDPNANGSSAGMGIKIPLGKPDSPVQRGANPTKDSDDQDSE